MSAMIVEARKIETVVDARKAWTERVDWIVLCLVRRGILRRSACGLFIFVLDTIAFTEDYSCIAARDRN